VLPQEQASFAEKGGNESRRSAVAPVRDPVANSLSTQPDVEQVFGVGRPDGAANIIPYALLQDDDGHFL
jgi:hypothetical protein